MREDPRSGCPINLAVESFGDDVPYLRPSASRRRTPRWSSPTRTPPPLSRS